LSPHLYILSFRQDAVRLNMQGEVQETFTTQKIENYYEANRGVKNERLISILRISPPLFQQF